MSTTATGRITGVDFTMISVTDIERSKDFYENTLGLERSKQWGQMPAYEYETGSLTLAICDMKAFGQQHSVSEHPLAFQVDDVKAMRERLEGEGVEFRGDTIDSGVCLMAIFADPDGNGLMLHQRYAPH
jgi:catechol 2,3-dioxygenase-like lactoylglutathione lyase family enzyme